ncbi:hypothetical protein PBY51_006434 [Eleginops maclovinus]|uniref:Uncharacterized protein n=1 Tax=Eleginops maclovinus TaxID=56733 RepID=A0AAN8A4J5_ELEMC|nr:hypothetical protein PBY51_006434 [Eleginops maclovinus]
MSAGSTPDTAGTTRFRSFKSGKNNLKTAEVSWLIAKNNHEVFGVSCGPLYGFKRLTQQLRVRVVERINRQVTVSGLLDWQRSAGRRLQRSKSSARSQENQSGGDWSCDRPGVKSTDGCPSCRLLPQISVAFGNIELEIKAGGRCTK